MSWLDRLVFELLVPLAIWVFASGLDDLYVDWLWVRARRKARLTRRSVFPDYPEARTAILIPCWRESDVIGAMLRRTLDAVSYENYAVWVGIYPNDPDCQAVVREVMEEDSRVHMAISRRAGPTTKADCLNQILGAIWDHEMSSGECYEIFVLHDAEDLVPPRELEQANRACRRFDMAQFPVFPLPTPVWNLTHGVYCDEFAESHTRDLPARSSAGGFVPSAGVGTALRRDVVDQCRIFGGRKAFDPGSLTEDYVLGLRLEEMGFSEVFVADAEATREYFPRGFRSAVRQRTRWIIGNCLQAWERYGWPSRQRYWLWRDRKGLINHPIALVSNILFLYGLIGWGHAAAGDGSWALGAVLAGSPLLVALLWTNAALLLWRQMVRAYCARGVYGWLHAITVPLRAPWSNWINAVATLKALISFLLAKRLRRPLFWAKTRHVFPEADAAGEAGWIASERIQPEAAAIIPADMSVGNAWLAIEFAGEKLLIVGPADPPPHELRRLAMRIGKELRFQRVTWRNYRVLQKAGRPAALVKGQGMTAGRP